MARQWDQKGQPSTVAGNNESLPHPQGTPEDVLRNLRLSARGAQKLRSLDIVWAALEEIRSEGSVDYSIASVGRRIEKLGGPKTQSLRNKGGSDFRLLISSFAEAQNATTRRRPARSATQVDQAIDAIPDMGVRVVLRMTLEEQRRLRHENDMLRNAFKELSLDLRGDTDERNSSKQIALESTLCNHAEIDTEQIHAIQRFLSEDWLGERGFRIDPDGSIVDETLDGNVIAPPQFVDALRRIVSTSRH